MYLEHLVIELLMNKVTSEPYGNLLNEPDVEKQQKQARNLADLALLSQGLLKGAELTNFINRSVDLLK